MSPPCPGAQRATGVTAAVKRGGAKEKCRGGKVKTFVSEGRRERMRQDPLEGGAVGAEDGMSSVGLRVRRQPLMTTTYPAAPPTGEAGFCR